jgi:hypothetical protein
VIVLVGLVGAGIYIPRMSKTQAKTVQSQPQTTPVQTSTAQSTSAGSQDAAQPNPPAVPMPGAANANSSPQQTATPAMSPAAESANAAQTNATPIPSQEAFSKKPANKNGSPSPVVSAALREAENSVASGTKSTSIASNAANESANLDELEHDVDQLSNRAAAVDASVDRLQQQQSAAGYGLRGDMAAKQSSMKNNLAKAQAAVEHGDAPRAKRYADLAKSDIEALEHFLGH